MNIKYLYFNLEKKVKLKYNTNTKENNSHKVYFHTK